MLKMRNPRWVQKGGDPHREVNTNKNDDISPHSIGDQQSAMAIAAMLNSVGRDSVRGDGGDSLNEDMHGLEAIPSCRNPLSLGDQQHVVSLASWMVFQVESVWLCGRGSQMGDMPTVMEELPAGVC